VVPRNKKRRSDDKITSPLIFFTHDVAYFIPCKASRFPSVSMKCAMNPYSPMLFLGSGSIVSQLAQERLIDEYQILLNPVVLGKGKTMFEGVKDRFTLKLTKTRVFGNGNVLLTYKTTN
jgi:dihydrofolate reductase